MTTAIVQALESLPGQHCFEPEESQTPPTIAARNEPSLSSPCIGEPISHGQIIELSNTLKSIGSHPYHLDSLLRGSTIYNISSTTPKAEKTTEYKLLMARLRREEEARAYERMINPQPPTEEFQRFPTPSAAYAFSSTAAYLSTPDGNRDEEMTYSDVNRQVGLIFNVLISVLCCAAALWMAARWWSTPARLALSMGGSLLVAIAEVVIYSGYMRRVGLAKEKEGSIKEVKEILKTWTVGGEQSMKENGKDDLIDMNTYKDGIIPSVRKRRKQDVS